MRLEEIFLNLLYGRPREAKLRFFLKYKVLISVLFKQNQLLMHAIQKGIIDHMWTVVKQDSLPAINKELFIKQSLCYLLQFNPLEAQIFILPEYDHDKNIWREVEFFCKKYPLTPKLMPQSDQYHVVVLEAKENSVAPWVILMATTYPANQGAWTTIFSDLYPFNNIGHLIAVSGKAQMQSILGSYNKVRLIGQSLGGALAIEFMSLNCEVTLINPALPYKNVSQNDVQVIALVNEGDYISRIGEFPVQTEAHLIRATQKSKFPFLNHIQSRLQYKDTVLEKTELKELYSLRSSFWVLLFYWPLRLIAFIIFWPFYIAHMLIAYLCQCFRHA